MQCRNLTDIELPAGLKNIEMQTFDHSGLEHIELPENVQRIEGGAFANSLLHGVKLPESLKRIEAGAFRDCLYLTSIELPGNLECIEPAAICEIGQVYSAGGRFVRRDDLLIDTQRNSVLWCQPNVTSVDIPDGVQIIEPWAFTECRDLETIRMPEGLREIGNGAFQGCVSLQYFQVPEGVQNIGNGALQQCTNVTYIDLPDSVTNIGEGAFCGCNHLTRIRIPDLFAKKLKEYFDLKELELTRISVKSIGLIPSKLRPIAVATFAEEKPDLTTERAAAHMKYIKNNAGKLIDAAMKQPELLHLMTSQKLIPAKELDAYREAVLESGNIEMIALLLEYSESGVSATDKQKAAAKQEKREAAITDFVFDVMTPEAIAGKCFAAAGKFKTYSSYEELAECIRLCGAVICEALNEKTDYLITNMPNSGSVKNKKAEQLSVKKITEDEFNQMIGRMSL